MDLPSSFLTRHRHHRIDAPAAEVLRNLSANTPLYVHARNWMAEMATVTPLMECVTDEETHSIFFPEQGLHLSTQAIDCMHSVSIEHRSRASLALEIATHGEPRAVSITALPQVSDLSAFADSLADQPLLPLTKANYELWREEHLVRPTICPCCAEAAEKRRENPETNPLTRLLCSAIDQKLTLHTQLSSPAFRFSRSFIPGNLLFSDGHITVTSDDGASMLEIDPGFCHSLTLHRRTVDAEPMTCLRLYSSLGVPELTIDSHGWKNHDDWLQLCRMS